MKYKGYNLPVNLDDILDTFPIRIDPANGCLGYVYYRKDNNGAIYKLPMEVNELTAPQNEEEANIVYNKYITLVKNLIDEVGQL